MVPLLFFVPSQDTKWVEVMLFETTARGYMYIYIFLLLIFHALLLLHNNLPFTLNCNGANEYSHATATLQLGRIDLGNIQFPHHTQSKPADKKKTLMIHIKSFLNKRFMVTSYLET